MHSKKPPSGKEQAREPNSLSVEGKKQTQTKNKKKKNNKKDPPTHKTKLKKKKKKRGRRKKRAAQEKKKKKKGKKKKHKHANFSQLSITILSGTTAARKRKKTKNRVGGRKGQARIKPLTLEKGISGRRHPSDTYLSQQHFVYIYILENGWEKVRGFLRGKPRPSRRGVLSQKEYHLSKGY